MVNVEAAKYQGSHQTIRLFFTYDSPGGEDISHVPKAHLRKSRCSTIRYIFVFVVNYFKFQSVTIFLFTITQLSFAQKSTIYSQLPLQCPLSISKVICTHICQLLKKGRPICIPLTLPASRLNQNGTNFLTKLSFPKFTVAINRDSSNK